MWWQQFLEGLLWRLGGSACPCSRRKRWLRNCHGELLHRCKHWCECRPQGFLYRCEPVWPLKPKDSQETFSRMRSKGSRFTLGVWGVELCSPDVAQPSATVSKGSQLSATVRNRSREGRMAVPMVSSAKGVNLEVSSITWLHLAWQAWHFVTCQHVSWRVKSRFAWQAQHFRRAVLRVFCKSHCQRCAKWWQGANSVSHQECLTKSVCLTKSASPRVSHQECSTKSVFPRMSRRTFLTKSVFPRVSRQKCLTKSVPPRVSFQECLTKSVFPRVSHQECLTKSASPSVSSQECLTKSASPTGSRQECEHSGSWASSCSLLVVNSIGKVMEYRNPINNPPSVRRVEVAPATRSIGRSSCQRFDNDEPVGNHNDDHHNGGSCERRQQKYVWNLGAMF